MSLGLPEYFAVTALTLFSVADLRTRLVPGIEAFFLASVLIAAPAIRLTTTLVVLAFAWGWLSIHPGLAGPAPAVPALHLAGAADRVWRATGSGGPRRPAGDCRAGLSFSLAGAGSGYAGTGSLAAFLASAAGRPGAGHAGVAAGHSGYLLVKLALPLA